MIEQLFRGLLRIDHDLNVVPELAQNMNVSADGLTYLFMLREDACWSDGHPAHRRRLRLRLAQAARGRPCHGVPARRHRIGRGARRLDARGASARAAQLLPVRPRLALGATPGRATAPTRSARPGAGRSRSSATGRSCSPRSTRRERACARTRTGARPPGNVGDVRIVFREPRRRAAARRLARRSLRPAARAETPRSSAPPTRSPSARRRSRRPSSASTSATSRWRTSACGGRSRTRSTARRCVADSPGVDLAAGRGGAIPPVMPGHSDGAGLAVRPRARSRAARRGRLSRGRRPARSCVVDARPWSPSAALAAQLAAVGVRARFETPDKHFGVSPDTHAWFAGWHADYPDPDGFYLGFLELGLPLYRDEETDAVLGAGARLARPRRAPAAVPRVRAHLDRPARGARADLVRAPARPAPAERARPEAQPDGRFHLEQVVVTRSSRQCHESEVRCPYAGRVFWARRGFAAHAGVIKQARSRVASRRPARCRTRTGQARRMRA